MFKWQKQRDVVKRPLVLRGKIIVCGALGQVVQTDSREEGKHLIHCVDGSPTPMIQCPKCTPPKMPGRMVRVVTSCEHVREGTLVEMTYVVRRDGMGNVRGAGYEGRAVV